MLSSYYIVVISLTKSLVVFITQISFTLITFNKYKQTGKIKNKKDPKALGKYKE